MISKVEENVGVFVRFENRSCSCSFVTCKNINEVGSSCISSFVVDIAAFINISSWGSFSSWFIEESTWDWVSGAVSSIIIIEVDDMIFKDALLFQKLVSVTGISLMSIVSEST